MENQNDNLYRSQFVLGPHFLEDFPAWQRLKIGESFCLTAHPSLNVCQQLKGEESITLLGFILDPESPKASDAEILSMLLETSKGFQTLLEKTYRLGGRWILIFSDGSNKKLFHDACGLRHVFYARSYKNNPGAWCASQPEMIGDLLKLQVDREADEFFRLHMFQVDRQCWWPGDSSPFLEVRHLLPNHYLDLETVESCRYWPQTEVKPLSIQGAIDLIGKTLKGMMEAACNRFDLSLGLTAGFDSRLVLAASRAIAHKVSFHTIQDLGEPKEILIDISVAQSLLKKLGLKHNLILSSTSINDELFQAFSKSVRYNHPCWYPGIQATREFYHLQKVGVSGNCSEIGRCVYGVSKQNREIPIAELSGWYGMNWHPFPRRYFLNWLDDLGEPRGYKVSDLFYWEQRTGRWAAMCQAEWDMAWKDLFTPFNCRLMLTQMLAVKEEYRYPWYDLHTRLISDLWSDLMQEPINPHQTIMENPIEPFKRWVRYKFSAATHTFRCGLTR